LGRKKKYDRKSVQLCVSMDPDVMDSVEIRAKKLDMTVSAFVNDVLKQVAKNDSEYCRMKAKTAMQDFQYWNARKEVYEGE